MKKEKQRNGRNYAPTTKVPSYFAYLFSSPIGTTYRQLK